MAYIVCENSSVLSWNKEKNVTESFVKGTDLVLVPQIKPHWPVDNTA